MDVKLYRYLKLEKDNNLLVFGIDLFQIILKILKYHH